MKVKNMIICMSLLLAQPIAVYADNTGSDQAENEKITENAWGTERYESRTVWAYNNSKQYWSEPVQSILHYLPDQKQYERVEYIDNSHFDSDANQYLTITDLIVERYDDNLQFVKSKKIAKDTYRINGVEDKSLIWC